MSWSPRADVGGGKWTTPINVSRRRATKASAQEQATSPASLIVTLDSLVLTAAGVEVVTPFVFGQLSASLDAVTVTATGVSILNGAASISLSPLTISATSKLRILGQVSVTLGAATVTATSATRVSGSLTATFGALTLNASSQAAIDTPVLTLVSADGTAPVEWNAAGTVDIGTYLEVEVVHGIESASDAIFTAGDSGVGSNGVTDFNTYLVIMQGEDWALADSTIEGFIQPSAAYTVRARYRTNPYDPSNSTDSGWSNKISDTITSSVAEFAHITSTDYKNNLTFTNNYKTIQGQTQNSGQSARATIAGADKGQVEITLDAVAASSELWCGFENGTTDFSVFAARPGQTNSAGVVVNLSSGASSLAVFWNSTVGNSFPSLPSASQVGDKIQLIPNRTTNALKIYHVRGATRTLVATITVAGLSGFTRFFAGMKNADKITANFGGTAMTLDSGDVIYG